MGNSNTLFGGFKEQCEECHASMKIVGADMKQLLDENGNPYQRYWDVLLQCPKCNNIRGNQYDL